ncbi:MAG: hypothetical protein AAFU70_11595, partial [Planctomycetota bacterium]
MPEQIAALEAAQSVAQTAAQTAAWWGWPWLAGAALAIAALPLAMAVWNLGLYRRSEARGPAPAGRAFVCIP